MKRRKIPNNAPVTYGLFKSELKNELKKTLKKELKKSLAKALKPYATKEMLVAVEARLNLRCDGLSRAIAGLEKTMKDRFDRIDGHIAWSGCRESNPV